MFLPGLGWVCLGFHLRCHKHETGVITVEAEETCIEAGKLASKPLRVSPM